MPRVEQPELRFDGPEYRPDRDNVRLGKQLARIFGFMRDSGWWTLTEIEVATGDPPASISAQLRHLRKARFGAHTVERRLREGSPGGLYEYRLILNEEAKP